MRKKCVIMKKGFLVEIGRKYYVLISDKVNITDDIARKFIAKILELKGKNQEYINIAMQHRPTLNDVKYRCKRCTFEVKDSYYSIKGKSFGIGIPFNYKEYLVVFN